MSKDSFVFTTQGAVPSATGLERVETRDVFSLPAYMC